MNVFDVALIGVGLSMDAVAVSMSNGMVYRGMTRIRRWAMPLFFGGFQALMPLLGFFAGSAFAAFIERFAGWIILLILGVIGGKMIWDGLHGDEEREACPGPENLSWKLLAMQAVATSIDAFAVGVGFSAVGFPVGFAVAVIGCTTFLLSCGAIVIGKMFGAYLEDKAQIFGGAILVLIGVKSFFGN